MLSIFTTSIGAASLLAIAVWLFRTWIGERLTADIRLENDTRLEDIRAQISKSAAAIETVVSSGGMAFSQAQVALLPHKIKAIDQLWSSVVAWNEMSPASMLVGEMTEDWIRKNGSDAGTKRALESALGGPKHLEFLKEQRKAELVRPFVSERSWALYRVYNEFYISRTMKASLLANSSINAAEIWARIRERDLIEASAPAEILKKYDESATNGTMAFLGYLQEELIKEFHVELSGDRQSDKAAQNSAVMLAAAERLVEQSHRQTIG